MKLTPHFSLGEMTKSQTALRLGLDNNPDPDGVASLRTLCWQVLEPVRKHFDRPVIINSGYRAEAVNTAIGSKPTSQHCKAQAADIEIPGVDNLEIYQWITDRCEFDQLILEYYTGEPESGWVHVSYVSHETNRRERLRIDKAGVRRD
jgi:zinc D-Ala-D-Ala carboxypeptidase|tara:strand:+ start:396 stop:839 length:444 start_codon:yes stop_codon:yes gene_type:complete